MAKKKPEEAISAADTAEVSALGDSDGGAASGELVEGPDPRFIATAPVPVIPVVYEHVIARFPAGQDSGEKHAADVIKSLSQMGVEAFVSRTGSALARLVVKTPGVTQ